MRFSAIVCTVLSHGWEGYVSLLPLTPAVQLGGAVGGWVCSLQGLCCRLRVHAQPKSCEHTEGLHCFIPQLLLTVNSYQALPSHTHTAGRDDSTRVYGM